MTRPESTLFIAAGSAVTLVNHTFAGVPHHVVEDWHGVGDLSLSAVIFGREIRTDVSPHNISPCPLPCVAEWPDGAILAEMFFHTTCHATDRQIRLFGLACCRRVARLMTEERCAALSEEAARLGLWEVIDRPAVRGDFLLRTLDLAERVAETGEGADDLKRDADAAWTLYSAREHYHQWIEEGWTPRDQELLATAGAAEAVQMIGATTAAARAASRASYWAAGGTDRDGSDPAEDAIHRLLARDIFGLPTHLHEAPAEWLTPPVRGLARAIYDDGDFGLLPVLGDALEDAGCVDAAVLGHCRGDRPHVRGCWVVDLILGQS